MALKPWLIGLVFVLLLSAYNEFEQDCPTFEDEGEVVSYDDVSLDTFVD